MIRSIQCVVLLLMWPLAVSAQVDSLRLRPDVLRFGDGVLYTLTSPARWDGKDVLVLGGLLAGTGALTFIDQPVRDFWQKRDNGLLDGVERIGYHYGKAYSAIGITAGFYLSGMMFKSVWAKETGLMLASSIFSTSIVMGVLKNTAGRARPGATSEHFEFSPFNESAHYHAFPSGHSSTAFGISVLLAKRVDSIPLKIFFYSLAGTTAVSRMYSDSHWLSDIAFGGALAWFMADTAMTRVQMNRFKKQRSQPVLVWKVSPYPGGLTFTATVR